MDNIRWEDKLKTGHAVIDADHETLVHLFNQVAHAANHPAGKLVCNKILDQLIRHTKTHFELEERLMAVYRYPKMAQHKAEHATLIFEALEYKFKCDTAEPQIPLIEFPQHWATFHMLTADKELSDFLAGAVRRNAPAGLSKISRSAAGRPRQKSRS